MPTNPTVTQLIEAHGDGNAEATAQLFSLVYEELRTMAQQQLRLRQPGETFPATALVHEAYLKLSGQTPRRWNDRGHFFAVMARAMRQILVDYARHRQAQKRGGAYAHTTLETALIQTDGLSVDLLDLDKALSQLTRLDARLAQVVELRFFGGCTLDEISGLLGVTTRTVDRDWYKAKTLLYLMLNDLRSHS